MRTEGNYIFERVSDEVFRLQLEDSINTGNFKSLIRSDFILKLIHELVQLPVFEDVKKLGIMEKDEPELLNGDALLVYRSRHDLFVCSFFSASSVEDAPW